MDAPAAKQLNQHDDGDELVGDRIERCLIAALFACPLYLDLCAKLQPADFRNPDRAAVYTTIRAMADQHDGAIDPVLVIRELERSRRRPPDGCSHWSHAVNALLTATEIYDETFPLYVDAIREDAVERRIAARRAQ